MAHRLRYNIGWTLSGNSIFALTQWAVVVLIARVGSPEMVGSYALALAITAPIFLFANLNLRAYQATDVEDAFQFGQYLTVRLLTSGIALSVVGGLCLFGVVKAGHVSVVLAVSAAKALTAYIKANDNTKVAIRRAIVAGNLVDEAYVRDLATLPSREQLAARNRELGVLNEIGAALSASLDLDSLAQRMQ